MCGRLFICGKPGDKKNFLMNYRQRQIRLQEVLEGRRLRALMVVHRPNVRYLCGFTGSAGILVFLREKKAGRWTRTLFTDGRYTQQAREQCQGVRVVIPRMAVLDGVARYLGAARVEAAGFGSGHMTVEEKTHLEAALRRATKPGKRVALRPIGLLVEGQRMVKEPAEIRALAAAVKLGSRVFAYGVKRIRPGMSEAGLAAEIEYFARRNGAEGMSFDTLIAGGRRSALPHGVASANRLPGKGFVIMDLGVILGGYCSDMTRTVHLGPAGKEARRIYQAVLEAELAALSAVKPGAASGDVDAAARKVLRKYGYARYFTHSTGHGVGLEIHEPPRLGKGQVEKLAPGMVVTVEPGAYIPGVGGVRIEDMVLVTRTGCKVLTPTPKQLIEIT